MTQAPQAAEGVGSQELACSLEALLSEAGALQARPTRPLSILRVRVPVVDPRSLIQAAPSRVSALWCPPVGPQSIGFGEGCRLSGSGTERLAQVRRQAQELWRRVHQKNVGSVDPGVGPRVFGGFAFSPHGGTEKPWKGFGAARFVLPQITYTCSEKGAHLDLAVGEQLPELKPLLTAVTQALRHPRPERDAKPVSVPLEAELARPGYTDRVRRLTEQIQRGDLLKAMTAQELRVRLPAELDLHATAQALNQQSPSCCQFLFQSQGTCFLGASPERLLRKRGKMLQTEALAGTRSRQAEHAARDLMANAKEREEHQLVVAAIAEVLAPWCSSSSIPETPTIRQLKQMLHLCTPIECMLTTDRHILQLAERLHPTPAVGGAPRAPALRWIEENEPFDRGWYAGAVGQFDALGDGELVVALRSGVLCDGEAYLYAGAGIVRDSVPDAEYNETLLKLGALLSALRAAG